MEKTKTSTLTSRASLFSVRAALRTNAFERTPRKPNWSEVECEYLLQEIRTNLPVIRSRKPDGPGSRKSIKADMWNRMCMGLHTKRPTVMRSVRELKDKWKKLQFMAKQHITSVRMNPTARRNADGLVIIPRLVYRVLEARGQDPQKAGFCHDLLAVETRGKADCSAVSGGDNLQSVEQDTVCLSPSLDLETAIKEEVMDVTQMYSDQSPKEPDITLQIHSAVSLAPSYMQTDQPVGTPSTNADSLPLVPVAIEKAPPCTSSTSQASLSSTSFSISSRLLQSKTPRRAASVGRSYGQHPWAVRSSQTVSRPAVLNNQSRSHPSQQTRNQQLRTAVSQSQGQFFVDSSQDSTPAPNEVTNAYSTVEDLQPNIPLENNDHLLSHSSSILNQGPNTSESFEATSEEAPPLSSRPNCPGPRHCTQGLMGHTCDEGVVELQREVLKEERDKIRLEKEILEMQKEKLKIELMFLRQKVNGIR